MALAKVSFILADIFRYMYRRVFCVLCINSWNSARQNAQNQFDQLTRSKNSNEDPSSSVIGVSTVDSHLHNQHEISKNNKPLIEIRDANDEWADEQESSRVNIPLVIVVGCLLAYIVFGAYIFTFLENLTWVQGIYYSYVSLATIGN